MVTFCEVTLLLSLQEDTLATRENLSLFSPTLTVVWSWDLLWPMECSWDDVWLSKPDIKKPYSFYFCYLRLLLPSCQETQCGLLLEENWDDLPGNPDSSDGKESTCNAGDPSLTHWLGRSLGEGIGYPLQYPGAFLVTQMIKNLPAMRETWVRSLGWEDPLVEGMATHSSILAWRTPMDKGVWRATGHGVTESRPWLSK